jgi:hypothetical protein
MENRIGIAGQDHCGMWRLGRKRRRKGGRSGGEEEGRKERRRGRGGQKRINHSMECHKNIDVTSEVTVVTVRSVTFTSITLCYELITCPEESYRLWCVVVCDLETF